MKDELDILFERVVSGSTAAEVEARLAQIEAERPALGQRLRRRIEGWRALQAFAEQVRDRAGDAEVERLLTPTGGRDLTTELLEDLAGDCAADRLLTPDAGAARSRQDPPRPLTA